MLHFVWLLFIEGVVFCSFCFDGFLFDWFFLVLSVMVVVYLKE